ncbi:IclR family transcriptional regulator [Sphaerimonospora cavernae]|uniref:IclR family transcriptional regulator n=1 Tax=Sphaerimonospora cavernae TaxID=1740611 RepID=A0ABV6U5D6_9ACTN
MPRAITHQEKTSYHPAPFPPPPSTGSLEKATAILTYLSAAAGPVGLAELSRRTGLPKTTTHRLLGVLCATGLAQRIDSDYAIGQKLINLAGPGPRVIPGTRRMVLPHLIRLYEATRQTVNLAVPRGTEIVYAERVYGHGRVSTPSDEVDRAPLHCTAGGKVMLAFDHELNAAFRDRGDLPRMTRRTLIGHAALDRELHVVRRRGVAYSKEEFAEGIVCAAAPVFGPDGRVVMAVSVAGASPRAVSAEVADLVRRTAHAISAALSRPFPALAVRATERTRAEGPPMSFL